MWYLRRVVGDSMKPSYKHGQVVLVMMTREFRVGDVVVALQGKREVLKRIVDMKDGNVFLEGDNKTASTDSRQHGWLSDRLIMAKVIFPKNKFK
ncbi:S26 family signal peptidase [Candidatus Saccharibacteria bacterium]|nr:S26 family signal peptidase [Candidatus Saccharibacteria bacterium]MCA9328357.1 S26 family signal peptidase [Candidatus Saccharibacteria bacterium]